MNALFLEWAEHRRRVGCCTPTATAAEAVSVWMEIWLCECLYIFRERSADRMRYKQAATRPLTIHSYLRALIHEMLVKQVAETSGNVTAKWCEYVSSETDAAVSGPCRKIKDFKFKFSLVKLEIFTIFMLEIIYRSLGLRLWLICETLPQFVHFYLETKVRETIRDKVEFT